MINWVSTRDILPANCRRVLILLCGTECHLGIYQFSEWTSPIATDLAFVFVTHWAELSDINLPE